MYNKLFTKILDSSIWLEPTPTRIVWLTFIAAMDDSGFVQFASVANVAHRAIVTVDEAQAAIDCLEGPDPQSADPDNDGRRVERVPGGWMVLNADKYRAMVTKVVIQAQTRERVRRHRARRYSPSGNALVTPPNETVTTSEAEEGAEAEARSENDHLEKLIISSRVDASNSQPSVTQPPTKPNGNGNGNEARSKRPIFSGQRLTVHEWMLDDCIKTLGQHMEAFDLHSWFFSLDEHAVRTGLVVPKRDGGSWLQAQLVAEAQRRNIPLKFAVANPDKMTEDEKWKEVARLGPTKRPYAP